MAAMRSYELPFVLRSPRWPLILAALVALLLVLGIQQVVRQAVRQGELRRQEVAAHAEATWRCNFQRGKEKRDVCRVQANAPPRDDATTKTENALALAQAGR